MKKIVALVLMLVLCLSLCACQRDKSAIARDPDGFLGYSDSFWEWQAKQ